MFEEPTPTNNNDNNSDVVWGAKGIGVVINCTPRKTQFLLENGHLPAKKIAGRWCSTKTKLRKHIEG